MNSANATLETTDAAAVITQATGEPEVMQCMEVWGGNAQVDANVSISGLDLWVYSKPYKQADAGGDVYYLSSCATGRITRLLVADVSGHGEKVRSTAITLRDLMRRYVNQLDQTHFVRSLNREFVELSKIGTFATAIVMTFFGPTSYLTLCNAGHPAPLIYHSAEKRWRLLEDRADHQADDQVVNIPLGIDGIVDYEQFGVELSRDDLVLCYSDSLMESFGADGEMLGEAGLLRVVEQLDATDTTKLIPNLLAALVGLKPDNLVADDVTAMLFRANGAAAKTVSMRKQMIGARKVVSNLVRGLFPGGPPIALPDLNAANLLGLVSKRFNLSWKSARFTPGERRR
ncbi:MAG: serine/threonine-protein phosphatase [Anaerolineae bacterium]|nr:serine/threonine-protein phosphatase [Phycisphaerae bacterium]